MLESLRQYVEQGGVLIGVSTDFIMMSPDISICPLYINEAIEVDTDFSALNLVDFAFVPHYQDRKVSLNIAALQKYTRDHQIVVLACQDSGGIVVTEDKVKCIGDVIKVDER